VSVATNRQSGSARRSIRTTPEPRRQFLPLFVLLHHENKAGQISGNWGRHPDTKLQLQADGNQQRTKLVWEKTRWATLPTETQRKSCLLESIVETKGYRVIELTLGATDSELEARIDFYLSDHPLPTTLLSWLYCSRGPSASPPSFASCSRRKRVSSAASESPDGRFASASSSSTCRSSDST